MYRDMELLIFGTVRQFSLLWDFFEIFLSYTPARADKYYACGYFITRADIDMI